MPTTNTVQAAYDPVIASLVAIMMASMEAIRERLDESDAKRRDGNGQFGPRQIHRQQGRCYFNGRGRIRGCSVARGKRTTHRSGQYCHTYGNCVRTGRECNARAEGHKETASFSNMMVRSNRNSRVCGNIVHFCASYVFLWLRCVHVLCHFR